MRRRILRAGIAVVVCYTSWLGMLVIHEFGHMLAAWASGGRIVLVSIPLFGFSQTIVHPDPHELFVVWGGPILGATLPLLALLVCRIVRRPAPTILKFFAGFCAVANGAYIGFGWIRRAGDTGDMLRLGTPLALLIAYGSACIFVGLFCWHHTSWLSAPYWRRAPRAHP